MYGPHRLAWMVLGCQLAGCAEPAPLAPTPEPRRAILQATGGIDPSTLDRRAYCKGEARSAAGDWWSFSSSIGQTSTGAIAGTFLMANSLSNDTLFGSIGGGTLTVGASGGGTADLTGTLTSGAAITLRFTDTNSATGWDTFFFQLGGLSFTGEVRHGVVRLLRTRPLAGGRANQVGFRFDSRIGLFVLQDDLDREQIPTPEALPVEVLEVTHPNPVIDFQADQLGGYTIEPGGSNNVPPP